MLATTLASWWVRRRLPNSERGTANSETENRHSWLTLGAIAISHPWIPHEETLSCFARLGYRSGSVRTASG